MPLKHRKQPTQLPFFFSASSSFGPTLCPYLSFSVSSNNKIHEIGEKAKCGVYRIDQMNDTMLYTPTAFNALHYNTQILEI